MFSINPEITLAETLSSDFYIDERHFDLSKEKIFAKTWQYLGYADEIENVKPVTLLEEFIDESVLMVKQDGKIQCLSNVCTHRGKVLVEESGTLQGIRCGYHGRCFDLQGQFLSMPEFEGVKNFPSEKDNLRKISSSTWNKFVFASFDPIIPFSEYTKEIEKDIGGFDFFNLKLTSAKTYEVNAHWALYCENYLEGFHIPYVHNSLNEELSYVDYKTELFRYASLQTGFDKNGEVAAKYFFLFPNIMFNFYPWGISLNVVKPIRKDFTKVEYFTFVNDESKKGKGAGADLQTVEIEDQKIVESVQKGINSRFYENGRYSPKRETGTHHFHRLIAEFISRN